MGDFLKRQLVEGERVIFDRRHSLWDIWRNYLIGAGAIAALVLLLTTFKPGPGQDHTGYIVLISLLAAFFLLIYGVVPILKRRFFADAYAGKDFVLPVGVIILSVAGWIVLFVYKGNQRFADIWTAVVWTAFGVIFIGWLAYPILRWYFQHFILTDRRLILHEGILAKRAIHLPLDQVVDIRSRANPFERVFRYGDIVIESAGEYGQQPFTNIGNPEEVKRIILQQREIFEDEQARRQGRELATGIARSIRAEAPPAAPPQAAPSPAGGADGLEVVEGLRKLAELRDSGALTDEEFQRAKKELLDRMEGE